METQYIKCSGCRCLRAEEEYEMYKGTRRKTCDKCKLNRAKGLENRKEYDKKYAEINKDRIQVQRKEYRSINKDKLSEINKERYNNNKEKIIQKCKDYYTNNKEIVLERHKIYYENNIDEIKERNKDYRYNNKDKAKERRKQYIENNKCEHNKVHGRCSICNPQQYLVNIQRKAVRRVLNQSNLSKTKSSIEYLGCDSGYFKEYLQKKMTPDMTFENIHIDHIKPVSRFNLDDPDEFLDCCHYTNLQPLLVKDNLEKSNKWEEFDEIYWNENIKGKEYLSLYL